MIRTVEAVIDGNGRVELLEPISLSQSRRAIVTVLDEPALPGETALLAEAALSDWNRPEEDEAWSYLQPGR